MTTRTQSSLTMLLALQEACQCVSDLAARESARTGRYTPRTSGLATRALTRLRASYGLMAITLVVRWQDEETELVTLKLATGSNNPEAADLPDHAAVELALSRSSRSACSQSSRHIPPGSPRSQ
jgi:hypothetical protein